MLTGCTKYVLRTIETHTQPVMKQPRNRVYANAHRTHNQVSIKTIVRYNAFVITVGTPVRLHTRTQKQTHRLIGLQTHRESE